MKVKITTEIKSIIEKMGNTTRVKSGYKIYAALYGRSQRKNPEGYFDVPSTYMKSINDNYKGIIDLLIAEGIITYKQTRQNLVGAHNNIHMGLIVFPARVRFYFLHYLISRITQLLPPRYRHRETDAPLVAHNVFQKF